MINYEPTAEHNDVDQFDLYDGAVVSFMQEFESNRLLRGGKLPTVRATPDRAFAAIEELLRVSGANPPRVGNRLDIPLPFASVARVGETFDGTRYTAAPLRLMELVKNIQDQPDIFAADFGDVRYVAHHPLPYKLSYQTEVWCRNITTMNLVKQWILMSMNHGSYAYRLVDFSAVHRVYGTKWIRFELKTMADRSELEPGDKNRTLRFGLDFDLDAWIWRPVGVMKTAKSVQLQILDQDNNEILDQLDIDLLDQFRGQ